MQEIYNSDLYNIYIMEPKEERFSFSSIVCIPKKINEGATLYVETNNEEDPAQLNDSAKHTTANVLDMMHGGAELNPVLIPILPTNGIDGVPYFQQLSAECFDNNLPEDKRRIDLQLVKAIEETKREIFNITDQKINDKIFMHGYSASGVFAQRFALLHPELIDEVCVGGAIGSIPMPISEYNGVPLDYPIGINNFKEITGKDFNFDAYRSIKFRYYVAELEDCNKSGRRFTEDGEPAPMHDMSYMERSTPQLVGKNLRNAFGKNMFDRYENQLELYRDMGLNISAHSPYPNIQHSQIRNLAYDYINACQEECGIDKIADK